MIPLLATGIFTLAFIAFSVSADPILLNLTFFENDNCDTTSELGYYVPPDMSDPYKVQCSYDCIEADVGNSTNIARSAMFLPDNTLWGWHYGCFVWNKTDANGGNNQDTCNAGIYREGENRLISSGTCESQLNIHDGAIIQCRGISGPVFPPVSCT